jgi:transcriptional regulator with XRE-family HTH domain
MDKKVIGRNLRKQRLEKDVKQSEISKLLGITTSAYSKYENGIATINIDSLSKLAKFYKIPITELTEEKPFYEIKNGNNSPLSVHHSKQTITNNFSMENLINSINMTNALIETQSKILEELVKKMKNN